MQRDDTSKDVPNRLRNLDIFLIIHDSTINVINVVDDGEDKKIKEKRINVIIKEVYNNNFNNNYLVFR